MNKPKNPETRITPLSHQLTIFTQFKTTKHTNTSIINNLIQLKTNSKTFSRTPCVHTCKNSAALISSDAAITA